jgi:RHS repeat-associated protein
VNGTALTYDANGNMLQGYDGKVMTYDAENRPLTVQKSGVLTEYVYGADGSRLKLITGGQTTVTFAEVEVRNFLSGSESIFTQPHPLVRLENGLVPGYMHRDHLNSVHLVMSDAGTVEDRRTYKPFGEMRSWTDPAAIPDAKGWIGERYDAGAGLQYLNARYYDPELGLFLQPDWFEVTELGVGTNRYAYCSNDPINCSDRSGNKSKLAEFFEAIGNWLKGDSQKTGVQGINSVEGARKQAVQDAWKMEIQLVQRTGQGTREWSGTELELLKQGKKPDGYIGHHIESVSHDLREAADHRNIEFLTKAEHDARHAGMGGTKIPIADKRRIDRTDGGRFGRLPDLASPGAKAFRERAGRAIVAISESRTFNLMTFDASVLVEQIWVERFGHRPFASWEERCAPDCT